MPTPGEVRQAAINRMHQAALEADELAAALREQALLLSYAGEDDNSSAIRAAEQSVDRFRDTAFEHSKWLQRAARYE